MLSKADKVSSNHISRSQQNSGTTFFRKAGDETLSAHQKQNQFFGSAIQPKLNISSPDDPQEKEADAMAEKVMRMPEPMAATPIPKEEDKLQKKEEETLQTKAETTSIQGVCTTCNQEEKKVLRKEAEQEEQLQAKTFFSPYLQHAAFASEAAASMPKQQAVQAAPQIQKKQCIPHSDIIQMSGRGPPTDNMHFENNLSSTKGQGTPMSDITRQFMESRFNADFSGVRIHTGSYAESLSSHIQAQAFTHGKDIYFNSGKYSPYTEAGGSLLAHELTHTVQQGASKTKHNNQVSRKNGVNLITSQIDINVANGLSVQKKSNLGSLLEYIDLSERSGSQQLSSDSKNYLEKFYNTNLSDIKIYSDSQVGKVCSGAGIKAFVQGKNIAIHPAFFSMNSEMGALLLSEQISKSLQQRGIITNKKNGNETGNSKSFQALIHDSIKEVQTEVIAKNGSPSKQVSKPFVKKERLKGNEKSEKKTNTKKSGPLVNKKRKPKSGDGPEIKATKGTKGKSPKKPTEDPAFIKVINKTKKTSKNQKQHESAEKKSADAQSSAGPVHNEAEGKAKNRKTDGMDAATLEDKPFDAASFKAEMLKKIEEITPKNLEAAVNFKNSNKINEVKAVVNQKVENGKQATTGPIDTAKAQPLQVNALDNKQPTPLSPTLVGSKPSLNTKDAVPKQKTSQEISMQEQSQSLDDEMKANNISESQLKSSNEPSFQQAANEKQKAQKDAIEKPKQYQKDEAIELKTAKSAVTEEAVSSVTGMHGARNKNFVATVADQQSTKKEDENKRLTVTTEIERLYKVAEDAVAKALEEADTESNAIFDKGAEDARNEFEQYVDNQMTFYKLERYSGFWGGLRWLDDKLFGMPDEVNRFYTDGRKLYLDKMDIIITKVSEIVTEKLNIAKLAIKSGKKAIDEFVLKLPQDQIDIGKHAASLIQDKFDALEISVNDKRDALIDGLAKKYVDNVKKLDERIEALKEANKGLVDKVIGFLKRIWQVIKDLANLFKTILSRLASIIGIVISSPGGFFDKLGKAFKKGFDNFKNNFLNYLEMGLMEWLAVNLGIGNVKLPNKFSPGAILTLVLEVMGITKEHIRERAVGLIGERKVLLLESAGGLLYKIYNEGLGALWDLIIQKITDFKEIIWEAIKSFIKTKIIEAAITFILGLLNPIGAFVKVCMAIYNFLMMLVRFKDKIVELLDTIVNAVTDVASGAIDGAAKSIEKAFAKSIPIIIAFLAALLGLNDIAAKVRGIIMRIKARVDKAIDFAINTAWSIIGRGVEGIMSIEEKGKAMIEKGKDKLVAGGKVVAAKVFGWMKQLVGMEKKFMGEDGSNHRIFITAKGDTIELKINPEPASAFEIWINNIEIDISTDAGKRKEQKRQQAKSKAKEIDTEKNVAIDENDHKTQDKQAAKIRKLLDELSEITGHLFTGKKPDCSKEGSGVKFSGLQNEYATGMTANTLTNIKMPAGSVPSVNAHQSFSIINQRRNQGGSYYILGHLLNHNLGGTGKKWENLTPLTRQANSRHENIAEARIKNAVDTGNIVSYSVKANYGRSIPKSDNKIIQAIMNEEAKVPISITCHAELITPDEMSLQKAKKRVDLVPQNTVIPNNIEQTDDAYDLKGIKKPTVYLDEASLSELKTIGEVDDTLAQKIKKAWGDKMKHQQTRFTSFESLAFYVFSDGKKFTDAEQSIIKKMSSLGYVSLYTNK